MDNECAVDGGAHWRPYSDSTLGCCPETFDPYVELFDGPGTSGMESSTSAHG